MNKSQKRYKIYFFSIVYVFTIIGIIYTSVFVHEIIHVLQVEKPISLCYDFGNKYQIAHITAETDEPISEIPAYVLQMIFIIIVLIVMSYLMVNTFELMRDRRRRRKYEEDETKEEFE